MPYATEARDRVFQFEIPPLVQDAYFVVVPEEQTLAAKKYLPFSVVSVHNQSTEVIKLEVNDGTSTVTVLPSSSKSVSNIRARNCRITNLSAAATSAGEVSVEFQSENVGADVFYERLATLPLVRRLFPEQNRVGVGGRQF